MVVIKQKRAYYLGLLENRESATAIEAILAGRKVIPTFLILVGQIYIAQQYQQVELDPDIAIYILATRYSNNEICIVQLKYFNYYSKKSSISSTRLLILDSYRSYYTREFVQYYEDNNIIPFSLLPNLIYILQPLDIIVFQPLKYYYIKVLDYMVRDGLVNITKVEFLSVISDIQK